MRAQQLMAAVLAVCMVVAWLRTGRGKVHRTTAARLRELTWCAVLVVAALNVAVMAHGMVAGPGPGLGWADLLVLGAGTLIALAPWLARRIVPAALVLLGLYGFVVARDYGFWTVLTGSYGFLPVGGYDLQYYLVLPEAYGLCGLGCWLAWRNSARQSPWARLALGRLAEPGPPGQLWSLMLLPVVWVAADLLSPNLWFGAGLAGAAWTLALAAAAIQLIRRSPGIAAGLAAAGLICLGLAGLYAANQWLAGNWHLPVARNDYILYGAVAISSRTLAFAAVAQAVGLIGFGAWLAPRTMPQLRQMLGWAADADLIRRVQRLTESRAVAVDTAAADLRRLERDLHDGAQARLVALGMSLRAAERLIPTSPEAATALVIEAREISVRALTELRELVRGVHPPVLADRGLADAVRALALDAPMKIETDVDLPGRLAAPVETACYFAVAEVLTNAVKHSGAREGRISVTHAGGMLRIAVTDFGIGGADPARGSGLAGVEKRLATFDGIVAVSSPAGGPTMVVMEVPCALSSQKISSC